MKKIFLNIFILMLIKQFAYCNADKPSNIELSHQPEKNIISQSNEKTKKLTLGADKLDSIINLVGNKRCALVVNHTSYLSDNKTFLLDTLLTYNLDIKKIFAPEHGFRGNADAGETVKDGKDIKTGIPLISLYGKTKKPTAEMLADVDILIFDIQDVGVRFYTYTSTMLYTMQSAADNNKEYIVLDRPNPHDLIEGPVLEDDCKSFVGTMPIPVLHGLTVGELAMMIKGEGWANKDLKLTVIKMDNWNHGDFYSLPIKPSPNLPNDLSIRLYPSLCLFEGTEVSVGRGTYTPFQIIGFPDPSFGDFTFTPQSLPGFDKNPLQKDKLCYGLNLSNDSLTKGFDLTYFISFYHKSKNKENFISRKSFFDLLAGTKSLRKQIEQGVEVDVIIESWQKGLNDYKAKREKYLLYK